jgi:hypothetical protein
MTISITQQEKQFQPVTIIIDDERTANLLRYCIDTCLNDFDASDVKGIVFTIDTQQDYDESRNELTWLKHGLENICKQ